MGSRSGRRDAHARHRPARGHPADRVHAGRLFLPITGNLIYIGGMLVRVWSRMFALIAVDKGKKRLLMKAVMNGHSRLPGANAAAFEDRGRRTRRVFFSDLTGEPLQYLIRSHL